MDYYMSRTDDEVHYPLLYIPASEHWAQEVCIEFVTLKLSLLYNSLIQERLKLEIGVRNTVFIPEDCTGGSKSISNFLQISDIQNKFIIR